MAWKLHSCNCEFVAMISVLYSLSFNYKQSNYFITTTCNFEERLQLFHLARVVRAVLPEEIAVTLHHSEGHRAIILLPGKHCQSSFFIEPENLLR